MNIKRKTIGIIAEDESDVETLSVLIKKISKKDITVKKQVGRGCGRIKKNATIGLLI